MTDKRSSPVRALIGHDKVVGLMTEDGLDVPGFDGTGYITDEELEERLEPASLSDLKAGISTKKPIVPLRQHQSVFYALAKAAGANLASSTEETAPDGTNTGVYPEAVKTAIKNMLGVTDGVKLYQHKFYYEIGDEEYGDIYILSSDATPYTTLAAVPDAGLWNAFCDVLYNNTLYLAYQVKLLHLSGGRTRCQWFITDNTVAAGSWHGILDLTINDNDLDHIRDTVTEL